MKMFSSPLHLFQSYVVNLILIISIGDVKPMLGKICRIFFGLSVAHYSDRLIVGHRSLLVPKSQAQDCKKQSKKQHVKNNLLTSNIWFSQEISNLGLVILTLLSLKQYGKVFI